MGISGAKALLIAVCAGGLVAAASLAPGQVSGGGGAAAAGAGAQEGTTIAVNGTARVYRKPDFVDINLSVSNTDKVAANAQRATSDAMRNVIDAVGKLALPGVELQTGAVNLWPQYTHRNDNDHPRDVLVGYRADMSLRVRTTDVESVARVLDAAIGAGATGVDGVEFQIREAIEAREEAIRLATQAARRKAQVLAESLDLRITRIITAGSQTQQYGWWGRNYGNRMMTQMQGGMEGGGGGEGSAVVPGQIEVWAEVTLSVGAAGR